MNSIKKKFQDLFSNPIVFAALAAIFNTVWFHEPLWRYLGANLSFSSAFAWSASFLIALIITTLSLILFLGLGVFSNRLLKAFLIVVFLGNAVALYFIDQYQVMLNSSMMGNVLNTDVGEVSALIHPLMGFYIFFWGGIPAAVVWWWPLSERPWWHRALGFFVIPVPCLLLIYALSSTWLWIDQHAGQLGSRLLPWSYIVNTVRYLDKEYESRLQFEPLSDANVVDLKGQKRVVVLVIGESARADRQGLYGYERETNENSKAIGVISIPNVKACGSYTIAALTCILSHRGAEVPDRKSMGEPLPTYLYRQGVDVVWRTANSGHPPINVRLFQNRADIQNTCGDSDCTNRQWDELLLFGLKDIIANSSSQRIFIVLHLSTG